MHDALAISCGAGDITFRVKVVPGASRNRVAGVWDGAMRVQLSAPPEGGKANRALIRLLADLLDVPRRDISIASGKTNPHKTILIAASEPAALGARLAALTAG